MKKNCTNWNTICKRLLSVTILSLLLCSTQGCLGSGSRYVTLTDRDQVYVIPQSTPITVANPNNKGTIEIQADEDLVALYRGTLLELEKEANKRVLGNKTSTKKKMTIAGVVTAVFAAIGGLFKIISKFKKEKQ